MSAPNCPKCGVGLMRVCYPGDSYLSRDQFESVKAGDWYCARCADSSTRSGYAYFWDKDLPAPLVPDTELTETKRKLALAEAEKLRVESVLVGAAQELERKLADSEARVKELEVIRHAAMELAQYASYAEIVGRVSLNREQIREWSDKIFKLNLAIGEAMPRKDQ